MMHERPNRKGSNPDAVNGIAQRLGQALANADIMRPDKYQALQQRALAKAKATPGGFDKNQRLTDKGMLTVALVLESAVR